MAHDLGVNRTVSLASQRVGPWRSIGALELFSAQRDRLEEAARGGRNERGARSLAGIATYFKGSPLDRKHALRHELRRVLRLSETPRIQEFANLTWLREQGFLAPRPVLAGVFAPRGLPRYQFLFTEFLADAPTLADLFVRGTPAERISALESLATDLARLHAAGFVHRDLFPRNLLVCARSSGVRIAFLDAWRGGPGLGWRGPDHDLGCLFLDGASLFEREEQRCFLDTYLKERSRCGSPLPDDWRRRLARARQRVHDRESKRRQGLCVKWEFPF